MDIAVDSTSVYWTENGGVKKVSISGGTATTLSSNLNFPGDIAVDAANVYWADGGIGKVKKIALTGGTVTTVASASGTIGTIKFLALDSTNLYWTEANVTSGSDIKKLAK